MHQRWGDKGEDPNCVQEVGPPLLVDCLHWFPAGVKDGDSFPRRETLLGGVEEAFGVQWCLREKSVCWWDAEDTA